MKAHLGKKPLTLGEFVVGIYEVCGKATATGVVRLALKTNLVECCGSQRIAIASRESKLKESNIPRAVPITVAASTDAAPPVPAHPIHHILVVDGDSMVRHLSADVLIRSGYRVDAAEDGAAGWEALQTRHYHLLITEHDLPNLTGVELVRKLRSARMALPVIMATERPPLEALIPKPALHLAALLPKPFSCDQLLDTVRKVLRVTDRAETQTRKATGRRGLPPDGVKM